jgi:cellulose biosynthesis protein BcsQ
MRSNWWKPASSLSKTMENASIQETAGNSSQKELANDVALLFSWAKVENTPYRDFSRPRMGPSKPRNEGPEKAEAPADRGGALSEVRRAAPTQQQTTNGVSFPSIRGGYRETTIPRQAPPVLAVLSLAGGVGKTTICAELGKTLSSLGEQVLLVDATGRGLLPFHFGAREMRAGVRKFVSPDQNAPAIQVIAGETATQEWLDRDVKPLMANVQRTIFDLGQPSQGLLGSVLDMCTMVLVPLLPDLNSIISVARIESLVNALTDGANRPGVFYFFNRFNEHSMNDQRAREFVEQQCGQRLLPNSLRHGQELTEALQAGIAGADLTAGSDLSHDYLELASWVRSVAPVNTAVAVAGRWSEQ